MTVSKETAFCMMVSQVIIGAASHAAEEGVSPATFISSLIGTIAVLAQARGLKREDVLAGLNAAWDAAEDE